MAKFPKKGSNKRSGFKKNPSREQIALEVLGPSVNQNQYLGPIKFRFEQLQLSTYTTVICAESSLSSDSSGSLINVFPSKPSGSAWNQLIDAFDECRVLGTRVEYYPHNKYNRGVSVTTQPIVFVLDMDNSANLTSYADSTAFSSAKMFTLDDKLSFEGRMSGVTDAQFQSTNSYSSVFWLKYFATNLTVSTNYGLVLQYWRVQFRGIGF